MTYPDAVKEKIESLHNKCDRLYKGEKIELDFGCLGKIEVALVCWDKVKAILLFLKQANLDLKVGG